jgi:hypothetical protein
VVSTEPLSERASWVGHRSSSTGRGRLYPLEGTGVGSCGDRQRDRRRGHAGSDQAPGTFHEKGSMMILVVLTVVVIALMVAVLAVYLFLIGSRLNRIAGNLGDSLQSMTRIIDDSRKIGPGVIRINKTGSDIAGAVPLLLDDVDQLVAKTTNSSTAAAPSAPTPAPAAAADPDTSTADPAVSSQNAVPVGVGYMDA